MSIPMTRLGGAAFNHSPSNDAEAEYDRLRNLARQEAEKRGQCFDKAHQAYERGDGAGAKQLSEEGKAHGARMEQYNQQASEFIFRENNATGRVAADTLDLHGQFVEEAEAMLEQRIRYAQQTGQTHLHVIVGKGHHSRDHIQKLKPRVEQVCRELGLQYATEENTGRMYINLQGGPAVMPDYGGAGGGSHAHAGQQYGGHQQQQQQYGNQYSQHQNQQYPYQQHQQQQQYNNANNTNNNNNNNQPDEVEQIVRKILPRIFRKLDGCCTVM